MTGSCVPPLIKSPGEDNEGGKVTVSRCLQLATNLREVSFTEPIAFTINQLEKLECGYLSLPFLNFPYLFFPSWTLQDLTGPYCALLGLTGPYFAFVD